MAKCRPSKWVPWALLGAGLPLLAAYVTTTSGLKEDVLTRAGKALSANELTSWAALEQDGRDLTLNGTAPSQEAVDAAQKAVADTFGVRTVGNATKIVEPPKMAAPTVESINSTSATPEIKGSWDEAVAKTLAVTVAGTTYKLGENQELTTLAGEWTLKLAQPLAEGSFDVTVESSDGKTSLAAPAPGKVVVDLPDPLPSPTIESYFGNATMPTLKGTWPEVAAKAQGKNLQVKLGDTVFALGKNPELTSDGSGNWTLVPAQPLAEGDVVAESGIVGEDGKWQKSETPAKISIDLTPPAAAAGITAAADPSWPYPVTGTWAEEAGNSLSLDFVGRTYALGHDAAVVSDGKGAFSFDPKIALKPGSYDLTVKVADAAGNVAETKSVAAVVIPEPPKPEPAKAATPSATPTGAVWPYAITGKWDERPGNSLSATVRGQDYTLGRDAALTSDGNGNFSFAPTDAFPPGSYDVDFTTTGADGQKAVATAKAAIVVPEPPAPEPTPAPEPEPAPQPEPTPAPEPAPEPVKIDLPKPTISSVNDATGAPIIKGTWPSTVAKNLDVTVNARTYSLGKDANLRANEGNWTLLPGGALANGAYDVVAVASDDAGNSASDTSANEVVVDVPPPPPPPPPPPEAKPYDCVAVMNRIGNVFPIRFEYDLTDITKPFDLSVSQYAALLKDPRCTSINVTIEGHADFRGSEMYNVHLSERRAEVIKAMLEKAGVENTRMEIVGLGESMPLDPAETDEARAKNRRVHILAKP